MGEPIKLVKGSEVMVVYGMAQAAVHAAEGWLPENEAINLPIMPEPESKPEPVTEPEPAKPKTRKRKTASKKG